MGLRCTHCGRGWFGPIGHASPCSEPDGHRWTASDAYSAALRADFDLCPEAAEPREAHEPEQIGDSVVCRRCGRHLAGPVTITRVSVPASNLRAEDITIEEPLADPFVEPVTLMRGFEPNRELARRVADDVRAEMEVLKRCLPVVGHFDPATMTLSLEVANREFAGMDIGGPGEVWRGTVNHRRVLSTRGDRSQHVALWWFLTGEVPSAGDGNLIEGLDLET